MPRQVRDDAHRVLDPILGRLVALADALRPTLEKVVHEPHLIENRHDRLDFRLLGRALKGEQGLRGPRRRWSDSHSSIF
jgi:hypothetical protein